MLLEEFDVEKYERTIRGEGRDEERERGIQIIVEVLHDAGHDRDFVKKKLVEKYSLSECEAEEKTALHWK